MSGERDTGAPAQADAPPPLADSEAGETRSLVNDIEDLLVDARTWAEAEFTYQKTRAGFVAACLQGALGFAAVGAVLALVALIALAVGVTIALLPLVGPWGATGIVVSVLVLVVILLLRAAARRWREMMAAIREDREGEA